MRGRNFGQGPGGLLNQQLNSRLGGMVALITEAPWLAGMAFGGVTGVGKDSESSFAPKTRQAGLESCCQVR